MNDLQSKSAAVDAAPKGQYVPPVVRVMTEAEVLSAFQVNAAGTMGWWIA